MRRSLAALAVAVAAATLAVGCGGGGDDDDEAGDGPTTTATTVREAVDVSTPEAVVAALADAGISCDNLVSQDPEIIAFWGIEGIGATCSIGGDTLSIGVLASDDDLSDMHALLTDFVGFTSDENGQRVDTFWWVEVGHTVVSFEDSVADQTPRLAPIHAHSAAGSSRSARSTSRRDRRSPGPRGEHDHGDADAGRRRRRRRSQRSGRNPSATTPQASDPATKMPP